MNKVKQLLYVEQSAAPQTPQYFTRLVETSYGYVKFHFNRICTAEGIQYHISCMVPNRKVYFIQMAEILRQWHITPASKCPLWIKELEIHFEKAILESRLS